MNPTELRISHEIKRAIEAGKIEETRTLLTTDRERLTWMTPFGTWLHWAAMHGQGEIVKLLVELGIDINRPGSPANNTAICWAAARGHSEIVQFLIQSGASLDVSDSVLNPLFYAIIGRSSESAKHLLEGGIDARVRYTGQRMKNMDAIGHAEERGEKEIAALIRDFLKKHPEEKELT